MLNENLFDDKKDLEIAHLKMRIEHLENTIQRFKAYDEERKQYYAKKMERLDELEEIMSETCEKNSLTEIRQKMDKMKKQLRNMSRTMLVRKIEENKSPEELKEIIDNERLKKQNKKLKRRVEIARASNDELLMKMRRLEKELENNNATGIGQ